MSGKRKIRPLKDARSSLSDTNTPAERLALSTDFTGLSDRLVNSSERFTGSSERLVNSSERVTGSSPDPSPVYHDIATISELEVALHTARSEYEKHEELIGRVRAMRRTLDDIRANRKFTAKEIQDFKDAYEYHRKRLKDIVRTIMQALGQAKELWEEKRNIIVDIHKQGILDKTVAGQWNESLNESLEEIEKLDVQLKFLSIE